MLDFQAQKIIIPFYFPWRKVRSKEEQVTNLQVEPAFAGVEQGSWPKPWEDQWQSWDWVVGLPHLHQTCSVSLVPLIQQFSSLDQKCNIWLLFSRALFTCHTTCSELCVSYKWENMCVVLLTRKELLVQSCFPNPHFPDVPLFLFPRMTPLFLSAPFLSISLPFT